MIFCLHFVKYISLLPVSMLIVAGIKFHNQKIEGMLLTQYIRKLIQFAHLNMELQLAKFNVNLIKHPTQ